MRQFTDGVRLALLAGFELHQRWKDYWQAIQPWALFYIGFMLLDVLVYPNGNPSRLMSVLWMLLYFGLMVLMWWNWHNRLIGSPRKVDWQNGWGDPDFRDYASVMTFITIGLPIAGAFVVSLPLALFVALLGSLAQALYNLFQMLGIVAMLGALLYILSRFSIMSALMMRGAAAPIPTAWQFTARLWPACFSAYSVFIMVTLMTALMLGVLGNLLVNSGVPNPGLWLAPFQLSLNFFSAGWMIVLSQRLFEYAQRENAHG